jgi:hypothetical protein
VTIKSVSFLALCLAMVGDAQTWVIVPGPHDTGLKDVFNPSNTWTSGIPASNQVYPSTLGLPAEFTIPQPTTYTGSSDTTLPSPCSYTDTFTDGLTSYNPNLRFMNETGTISRSPGSYVQRSTYLTDVAGLAMQATFGAGLGTSATATQESVFYHSQRCFDATTEFGFFRNINGNATSEWTLNFYYADNANCPTSGTHECQIFETVGGWTTITNNLFTNATVSIPQCPDSASSGTDYSWVYRAWVTKPSGYQWNITVTDPYTGTAPPTTSHGITCNATTSSATLAISSSWLPLAITGSTTQYASAMRANTGLAGYITLTSALYGTSAPSSGPTMTLLHIWAPTY